MSNHQNNIQPTERTLKTAPTFIFEGEEFANMIAFSNAVRFPIGSDERAIYSLENLEIAKITAQKIAELGLRIAYLQGGRMEMKSLEYKNEVMPRVIQEYKIATGTIRKQELEANIISYGKYPLVSNFADTHFEFQGKQFRSAEAFIHYIKYPEHHPEKKKVAKLFGKEAKKAVISEIREEIHRKLRIGETPIVYWNGQEIKWRSPEHYGLIKEALRAKFEQNSEAYNQLKATGDRKLVHDTGRKESPNTSLPASEFTRILTELREEFRSK
jgi:predicted NAD-dependent protein-ADP-ribosyltransferase YbiA (DUF1768 family)